MGGGGGSQPPLQAPFPQAPDPFAVAQAQTGYNIDTAQAQNLLNNVNQYTPYGNVFYYQNGVQRVGASPGTAATPGTGGFWNGSSWQSTGGSAGTPATQGWDVPTYTRQVELNPNIQGLVNSIPNKPLDLSWGNKQNQIFGLERNSLDPYWKQQTEQNNQSLANQGLTPGSQGYTAQQTQFGINKGNAYDQAMLSAQGQAASDLSAEYMSPINALGALAGGIGVGGPSATAQVQPSPYAQISQSNYATGAQMYDAALQQQTALQQAQMQQQNQMMGGLFGLGGNLLGAIPGIISSDRRDKTDIKRIGIDGGTRLPMYAYRYKDDPKSYPKVAGVMAQDVEKKYPGSTTEISGHKVILSGAVQAFGLGGIGNANSKGQGL